MAGVKNDIENEAVKQFCETLETQSMASAVEGHFNKLDAVALNIAVKGESGSGKSSFVNALRGLRDDEEQSAPTGVVETTKEATPYFHPKFPNVTLWDLPGIGTPNFNAEEYLTKVLLNRYDFFILIASERFKNSTVDLAKEIKRMKKKNIFVRVKIDENIRAEERKKDFDQKKVLSPIKQDCEQGLSNGGVESPNVFLISSHELSKYDFDILQESMESVLPEVKPETLLFALPDVTMHIHQKKIQALQARIWKKALISAGIGLIPIPGLASCIDVLMLVTEIQKYYEAFGLDDKSLEMLSHQTQVPVAEFKNSLTSTWTKEISDDMVLNMLTKVAGGRGAARGGKVGTILGAQH